VSPADIPLVMKVAQVAEILNCDRKTVYRLIECGELPAISLGRAIRVTSHALFQYLELPADEVPPSPRLHVIEGGGDG
jgi:excisionase family DNA binding protein